MLIISTILAILASALFTDTVMGGGVHFDTYFVELDNSKLVSTSDSHYGLCGPNFTSNWRCVSVNADEVAISTKDNQHITRKYHSLSADEKSSLEANKQVLNNIIKLGPFSAKPITGLAKLTTFDRNGGTSAMGTGGSSSASSSSRSDGTSISRTGPKSFIITKSNFPFKWQRVFINDDVVTIVYKDGRVSMLPQELMRSDEKAKIIALRQEADKGSKAIENLTSNMSKSLKNPMDFVNKALGGMFGR